MRLFELNNLRPFDPTRGDLENLTEGISPVLYHFMRGPINALNILKQNQFKLTASPGTDTERHLQKGHRQYYLSTARHKLGGYHVKSEGNGIIFNLDGKKLAQNYTGKAVSYWGPDYYGNPGSYKKGYEQKEAEDRIYSYKPFIPDAIKYIQEMHVLFDIDTKYGKPSGPVYRRLIITAKRLGIPIYVYENNRDWLIQNKNKAVNPAKIEALAKAPSKEYDQKKLYSQKYKIYLGMWIELYMSPVNSSLSSRAQKLKREVLYGYSDLHRSLSAAIHNEKSKPADETGMETLLKIFRKEKITSSQQYIDLLRKKWAPDET